VDTQELLVVIRVELPVVDILVEHLVGDILEERLEGDILEEPLEVPLAEDILVELQGVLLVVDTLAGLLEEDIPEELLSSLELLLVDIGPEPRLVECHQEDIQVVTQEHRADTRWVEDVLLLILRWLPGSVLWTKIILAKLMPWSWERHLLMGMELCSANKLVK